MKNVLQDSLLSKRASLLPIKRIIFFGSFGPPALTIARSCRSMGISVYLLAPSDARRHGWFQRSCFSSFRTLDFSAIGTSDGIDAVLAYASEVGADAVTTLSDNHCLWLARSADRFKGICKLMLPSAHCLESVESKLHQIAAARDAGLSVLPTYIIRGAGDAANIESGHYPICLRPSTGNSVEPAFKVRVIQSPKELADFIGGIKTFGDGIVAQPFLQLPNAVLHCTSSEDGELLNFKAFLVDRKFEGLAMRIRPMSVPEGLIGKVAVLSKSLRLSGPYHFDFLYSPVTGEWKYLEVNVRFGGTTEKVIWFGVDEPANCLLAYGLTGQRPPRKFSTKRFAVVNKQAVLRHLLVMTKRGPEPWDYPLESRFASAMHSLGDLLFAKDSINDFRDIKGVIASRLYSIVRG